MTVTARACANIALVKYWGKRDSSGLNVPQAGSLSVTLDALRTTTQIELCDASNDSLYLDEHEVSGKALSRVTAHLDLFRSIKEPRAIVRSSNSFPTAAGLASSASGFAALTVAASVVYGHNHSKRDLSILARRGSGSAARSIFGQYASMNAGVQSDGLDAYAEPLTEIKLPLCAVIAVAKAGPKDIGSTEGMKRTNESSPYHKPWIELVSRDLVTVRTALQNDDFTTLAQCVEGNCLAMHANAMASRPGIIYFSGTTLEAISTVRNLRVNQGIEVFFTIDAGPHVVAFTRPSFVDEVAKALGQISGVTQVIRSEMGNAAHLM